MLVSPDHPEVIQAIVPTIVVPFMLAGSVLSFIVSFIVGLFGYKLDTSLQKRLLTSLVRPKVLGVLCVSNAVTFAGFMVYRQFADRPKPVFYVEYRNSEMAKPSQRDYRPVSRAPARADLTESKGPRRLLETRLVWQQRLPGGVFSDVTVTEDSVFAGSEDGHVYELDRNTGSIVRRFYVGTEVTPAPTIWKDRLFVGEGNHQTRDARVYAFDLRTGRFLSSFTTSGHTEGRPRIGSHDGVDSLFVVAGRDGLYSLDPETLKVRWHRRIGHVDGEVRVLGDRVLVSTGVVPNEPESQKHEGFALSFKTGETLWKAELAGSALFPPALLTDRVCFGQGEIYAKSDAGHVSCYRALDGAMLNEFKLNEPVVGTADVLGNTLAVATLRGTVCAFGLDRSEPLWCQNVDPETPGYASATHDGNGWVLYPTADAGIWGFSLGSGEPAFQWAPGLDQADWSAVMSSSVQILSDREWYVADGRGTVRMLRPVYR